MAIHIPALPNLIAHRGESGLAPENTIAAIELAARNGADWVEIDINTSVDGVAYLHHDDKLERCTNGEGYLVLKSSKELDLLDAGSWFSDDYKNEPLPRLSKLVPVLQNLSMGLNLEIKPTPGRDEATTDSICDFIEQHWPAEVPLWLSSFSMTAIKRARQRLPDIPTGMLVCAIPPDWQQQMEILECQSLHCGAEFLNASLVREVKQQGYALLCYTVNDPELAKQLLQWGVDSLFTDIPHRMAERLAER